MDTYREFISYVESNKDYAPTTVFFYRTHCAIILRKMHRLGIDTDPKDLTADELKIILEYIRANHPPSTQKDYLVPLKMMCRFAGNHVFDEVKIAYAQDYRPNVDWLEFDDCMTILHTWMTPMQELLLSLMLLHGLRKCETVRLTIDDLHEDYMTVIGKGRFGGKRRSIPYHQDFKRSLDRWMKERNELLSQCDDPYNQPRNVLVYLRGKRLRVYDQLKGSGITKQIRELSERCGIDFSAHTLRRTFGRELFRSGVSIEVIATIYGHDSTSVTMRYLGLDMDDMTDALKKMRLRFLD